MASILFENPWTGSEAFEEVDLELLGVIDAGHACPKGQITGLDQDVFGADPCDGVRMRADERTPVGECVEQLVKAGAAKAVLDGVAPHEDDGNPFEAFRNLSPPAGRATTRCPPDLQPLAVP